MLNTININLKTDIKTDRPTTLPIKLMSQDKNNNQFILRFTNGGESVTLDDTYTVEILTKFTKSGTSRLTTARVRQDYATWNFDTSFITQDETVYNYVYVRKSGSLVVSADSNAFYFEVGLSEIDKGAGKVAETYDENYEKYLDEFKDVADFTVIQQAEADRESSETIRKSNESARVQAETSRIADENIRKANEIQRNDKQIVLKNLVVNGDFSQGTTGWGSSASATLTVSNNKAKITGTGSSSQLTIHQATSMNSSDNYYYSGVFENLVGEALSVLVGTGISSDAIVRVPNPIHNVKYPFSAVVKGSSNITLRAYYLNAEPALGAEVIFYNVLAINLTQTFGAGNEPTKEQMDELLAITGYISGERIMSHQELYKLMTIDTRSKATGIIAENLVENGDFSQGTTGWYSPVGSMVALSGEVELTLTSLDNTSSYIGQPVQKYADHVYYASFEVKPKYTNFSSFFIGDNWSGVTTMTADVYNTLSTIHRVGVPGLVNHATLRYRHDTATNYVVGDKIYYRNMIFIDLTETFGAGNEPTKAEMDAIMSEVGYFNGKKEIVALADLHKGKASRKQEDWITPTLLGGATGTVAYLKDEFGFVHFKGRVNRADNITTMFVMPSGYRPDLPSDYIAFSTGDAKRIRVNTSGNVDNSNLQAFIEFSNVIYKAER